MGGLCVSSVGRWAAERLSEKTLEKLGGSGLAAPLGTNKKELEELTSSKSEKSWGS